VEVEVEVENGGGVEAEVYKKVGYPKLEMQQSKDTYKKKQLWFFRKKKNKKKV